jgi:hypothetical protein
VPGGAQPASVMTVTEEGALYALFTAGTARRYWRVRFANIGGTGPTPIVPGVLLGLRTQLAGFANLFDEDAGGRKVPTQESDAGYLATGRAYTWRTLELDLRLIASTEYDATIRALRTLLFETNQPVVVTMDYGTRPERSWMYQFDGARWSAAMRTVHRDTRIPLREVGPRLTR